MKKKDNKSAVISITFAGSAVFAIGFSLLFRVPGMDFYPNVFTTLLLIVSWLLIAVGVICWIFAMEIV